MSFNISRFRTNMINDGARPNLFEVELTLPGQGPSAGGTAAGSSTIPELAGTGATSTARFLIKAAQLPGSTVGTVTVPYFGREVKFAGNRTFPDWTVTVINDEDFKLRNTFERWLNYINGHDRNLRGTGGVPTLNYFSDLSVRQYSKGGDIIKGYKFIQAFPVDVSPIDVNWGDNDAIEEFTVTFAYQYWLSDTTDLKTRFDPLGDQSSARQ